MNEKPLLYLGRSLKVIYDTPLPDMMWELAITEKETDDSFTMMVGAKDGVYYYNVQYGASLEWEDELPSDG